MTDQQQATLPPAQPQYILRGHGAQIHAVAFLRDNSRLLTGDADGWVVLWDVTTKRPVAVWRAHAGTILGVSEWTVGRIITHGRDSTLKVWELKLTDEDSSGFSTTLPVDDPDLHRKKPWLLHSLVVNTLTFCSFSYCREQLSMFSPSDVANKASNPVDSIYVAVPAAEDSKIDIYHLPTEQKLSTVQAPSIARAAMVMATRILFHREHLIVLAGYESGHTCLFDYNTSSHAWDLVYACQGHTQPVLSLDVAPVAGYFFTSSADDIIARHPLCVRGADTAGLAPDIVHTKHAGQQSLRLRDDEKIFATAGWDSRVRVYSIRTMEELAVLKWHKEGCYAVAFAQITPSSARTSNHHTSEPATSAKSGSGSNSALVSAETISTLARATARQRREAKAQTLHWIAVGSKDGKVSLWDLY